MFIHMQYCFVILLEMESLYMRGDHDSELIFDIVDSYQMLNTIFRSFRDTTDRLNRYVQKSRLVFFYRVSA